MAINDSEVRWCLITGVSAGGLGDALTTELLKRPSFHVIATGLELGYLDYLENSANLAKVQLDVTSASSISTAVRNITDLTGGRLHYLVNNAGYGYMMPLLDAGMEAVRHNFEVNVFGLLAVTQAFFPLLKEAQGTVVNQCSIASLPPGRQPYIGTYCATKAAVASLNDTMRLEFAPFGVKVICLVTGDVKTGFWTHTPAAKSGLPSSSPYDQIRSHVETMMRGDSNPPGQHSRERWASAVIGDLLESRPNRFIRRGFLAWTMYLATLLLPIFLIDWIFTKAAKLGELKRNLDSSKKKR